MNMENFKRVMDQIRAQPELWCQEVFATPVPGEPCRTAYCATGWCLVLAANDAGATPPDHDDIAVTGSDQIIGGALRFLGLEQEAQKWDVGFADRSMPFIFDRDRTLEDLECVERGSRDPVYGKVQR